MHREMRDQWNGKKMWDFSSRGAIKSIWNPTARAVGAGGELRAAMDTGRRPRLSGVIGAAPFALITETEGPLSMAFVIASTAPIMLTNAPGTRDTNLLVDYWYAGAFADIQLYVSVNWDADADPSTFLNAVASVVPEGLRSFEGDHLFLTFTSQVPHVTISGSSAGLATWTAVNGFHTDYVLSGEIAFNGGSLSVLPIAGVQAKALVAASMDMTLVTPHGGITHEDLMASGLSYITAAQVNVGVVMLNEMRPRVIFIDSIASMTVLFIASDRLLATVKGKVKGPSQQQSAQDSERSANKAARKEELNRAREEVRRQIDEVKEPLMMIPDWFLDAFSSGLTVKRIKEIFDGWYNSGSVSAGVLSTFRKIIDKADEWNENLSTIYPIVEEMGIPRDEGVFDLLARVREVLMEKPPRGAGTTAGRVATVLKLGPLDDDAINRLKTWADMIARASGKKKVAPGQKGKNKKVRDASMDEIMAALENEGDY